MSSSAGQSGIPLVTLAVEMNLLSVAQAQAAQDRHQHLLDNGIKLQIGQVLLERRYISPTQLKQLFDEFYRRKEISSLRRGVSGRATRQKIKKFGTYELHELLSEKPHARVYRAYDTTMDRMVVLKILPRFLKNDPLWADRFKRETVLLGKLSHPNLISAYGATEIEGNPVIAMEWVEGMSVGDRLDREGNIPEKEAWLIAREVGKALAYAARAGILHRDIKPDNILCSKGGRVKLIDLGLSKSVGDTSHLTQEGTTVGTPFYISPEQARGTRDLDPRCDIYSLGCSVFHMLTGSPPFLGEELTEIMLKHVEAPRPDPRELLPEISEGSVNLVTRMMSIELDGRPPSAEILVDEIDTLLPSLPKLFSKIRPATSIILVNEVRASGLLDLKQSPIPEQENVLPAPPVEAPKRKSLLGYCSGWFMRLIGRRGSSE